MLPCGPLDEITADEKILKLMGDIDSASMLGVTDTAQLLSYDLELGIYREAVLNRFDPAAVKCVQASPHLTILAAGQGNMVGFYNTIPIQTLKSGNVVPLQPKKLAVVGECVNLYTPCCSPQHLNVQTDERLLLLSWNKVRDVLGDSTESEVPQSVIDVEIPLDGEETKGVTFSGSCLCGRDNFIWGLKGNMVVGYNISVAKRESPKTPERQCIIKLTPSAFGGSQTVRFLSNRGGIVFYDRSSQGVVKMDIVKAKKDEAAEDNNINNTKEGVTNTDNAFYSLVEEGKRVFKCDPPFAVTEWNGLIMVHCSNTLHVLTNSLSPTCKISVNTEIARFNILGQAPIIVASFRRGASTVLHLIPVCDPSKQVTSTHKSGLVLGDTNPLYVLPSGDTYHRYGGDIECINLTQRSFSFPRHTEIKIMQERGTDTNTINTVCESYGISKIVGYAVSRTNCDSVECRSNPQISPSVSVLHKNLSELLTFEAQENEDADSDNGMEDETKGVTDTNNPKEAQKQGGQETRVFNVNPFYTSAHSTEFIRVLTSPYRTFVNILPYDEWVSLLPFQGVVAHKKSMICVGAKYTTTSSEETQRSTTLKGEAGAIRKIAEKENYGISKEVIDRMLKTSRALAKGWKGYSSLELVSALYLLGSGIGNTLARSHKIEQKERPDRDAMTPSSKPNKDASHKPLGNLDVKIHLIQIQPSKSRNEGVLKFTLASQTGSKEQIGMGKGGVFLNTEELLFQHCNPGDAFDVTHFIASINVAREAVTESIVKVLGVDKTRFSDVVKSLMTPASFDCLKTMGPSAVALCLSDMKYGVVDDFSWMSAKRIQEDGTLLECQCGKTFVREGCEVEEMLLLFTVNHKGKTKRRNTSVMFRHVCTQGTSPTINSVGVTRLGGFGEKLKEVACIPCGGQFFQPLGSRTKDPTGTSTNNRLLYVGLIVALSTEGSLVLIDTLHGKARHLIKGEVRAFKVVTLGDKTCVMAAISEPMGNPKLHFVIVKCENDKTDRMKNLFVRHFIFNTAKEGAQNKVATFCGCLRFDKLSLILEKQLPQNSSNFIVQELEMPVIHDFILSMFSDIKEISGEELAIRKQLLGHMFQELKQSNQISNTTTQTSIERCINHLCSCKDIDTLKLIGEQWRANDIPQEGLSLILVKVLRRHDEADWGKVQEMFENAQLIQSRTQLWSDLESLEGDLIILPVLMVLGDKGNGGCGKAFECILHVVRNATKRILNGGASSTVGFLELQELLRYTSRLLAGVCDEESSASGKMDFDSKSDSEKDNMVEGVNSCLEKKLRELRDIGFNPVKSNYQDYFQQLLEDSTVQGKISVVHTEAFIAMLLVPLVGSLVISRRIRDLLTLASIGLPCKNVSVAWSVLGIAPVEFETRDLELLIQLLKNSVLNTEGTQLTPFTFEKTNMGGRTFQTEITDKPIRTLIPEGLTISMSTNTGPGRMLSTNDGPWASLDIEELSELGPVCGMFNGIIDRLDEMDDE